MKRYLLIILLSLLTVQVAAQSDDKKDNGKDEEEEEKWTDDLFFGGSIWAQFGSITQVEVAPVAGYHISPRFDAGLGVRYIFYQTNFQRTYGVANPDNIPDYSAHIFGGNVFTRVVLIKDMNELLPIKIHGRLVSHFEYEGLNMPSAMDFTSDRSGQRFWSHNYLVGGGLQQKIGEKAYLNLLILYNLNEKSYSLYENPIIRIGVNF